HEVLQDGEEQPAEAEREEHHVADEVGVPEGVGVAVHGRVGAAEAGGSDDGADDRHLAPHRPRGDVDLVRREGERLVVVAHDYLTSSGVRATCSARTHALIAQRSSTAIWGAYDIMVPLPLVMTSKKYPSGMARSCGSLRFFGATLK